MLLNNFLYLIGGEKEVKSDQFLTKINLTNFYNVWLWNSLERVLNFFYHISGILNRFSNPCISETIYCHFLVIFKSVVQIDNPLCTSHPLHMATDQSKSVSYTDSSSEEEDLHIDVNFHEPIDLAINQFSIFKIEFQRNR